ncbi:hypothetical protein [uncultured Tateyamaria sp.]|uniref:hypothetical protein n=1 Tax=uncultured Tateyamaria sp. TaxID=455651 RepID=UPI002630F2EC|nr:hypothetical protein [uncultured Tateyamaria sp.]
MAKNKHKDDMFEVPVRIIGAPGSGKTMLATLAEFKMVETILSDQSSQTNRDLAGALEAAGFLDNGRPRVAAVRIPMESEYRQFWELPYDDAIKTKLAFRLLQARAMLDLIRNLTTNGYRKVEDIKFVARTSFEAQLDQIGGLSGKGVQDRARVVQKAIYSVAAGLRAPKIEDLPQDAIAPYAPFDAIKHLEIIWQGQKITVNPLVMLDDVHALHPDQLGGLFETLSHREMRFGRWLMMRLDALSPSAVLRAPDAQETFNRSKGRDFVDIKMQGHSDRNTERKQFRKMAVDMANRYLGLVQSLSSRNVTKFDPLLPSTPPRLTDSQLKKLVESVEKEQKKLKIGDTRRREIEQLTRTYLNASKSYDTGEEVALAMLRILMHQHDVRRKKAIPSLFEEMDPDPINPLKASSDVAHGARTHLHHQYNRPLHYGLNDVCDASNENAELFLQFSGALIEMIETKAIRGQDLTLVAKSQENVLREKALSIMNEWSFQYARQVRALVDTIGKDCVEGSMAPNAPLGGGPNAIGVLESEMRETLSSGDEISRVLKHGIANGAISVSRDYGQGGKKWALIELTGTVCLVHGLTFNRGGFLERDVAYLRQSAGC